MIELAGDKLRAREEAERAGVPVLPGRQIAAAQDAAGLGFPLLIKAAGGGGGRGIKLARDQAELRHLLGLARSEAGAAFGDDRVYVERYIDRARHLEVQIAADERDSFVHLASATAASSAATRRSSRRRPRRRCPSARAERSTPRP